MTTTLQEALIKAGVVSKEKAREEARKKSVPRHSRNEPKKTAGFIEGKHQHHLRTDCAACKKNSPDVEYYEHRNRSLEAKWLCVTCADQHNILDESRQTMQSQHAQSKRFRRQYGATKIFK